MSILGLDNGYYYTKTSEKVMFISSFEKGKDIDINKDTIQVNIDNKDYIIGSNTGEFVADGNKIDSLVTELCTITAIAKSYPNEQVIECNMVAGLPVQYYASQKEAFKNKLISYGQKKITIGDKTQHIRIKDAEIYPQSVGVVFMNAKNYKNETTLVIDIGGGTIDVSYFEGLKMVDKATYNEGMLVLYTKLSQMLKGEYNTKFKPYDMDRIIQNKTIQTEQGKISTSILNPITEKQPLQM
jgi:plasmid segregation protein ParM